MPLNAKNTDVENKGWHYLFWVQLNFFVTQQKGFRRFSVIFLFNWYTWFTQKSPFILIQGKQNKNQKNFCFVVFYILYVQSGCDRGNKPIELNLYQVQKTKQKQQGAPHGHLLSQKSSSDGVNDNGEVEEHLCLVQVGVKEVEQGVITLNSMFWLESKLCGVRVWFNQELLWDD